MTNNSVMPNEIHEGRNVKRFREMLGIKQDALAFELGEGWNQKRISLLEQKETIEPAILQQVSAALKIPVEAFQNFDEEQAINIIANTFHDSAVANTFTESSQANLNCTFNPIDKLVESFEEIKRLNTALLKEKDEKIELLQRMLDREK
ncbi:MAG TPA: helix-turn-helix transcriptional regulator [Chitinophagaceae bacterium]|nr:helix-turn-helix transcriptional regulator [Chitinophagaceae bacterium]